MKNILLALWLLTAPRLWAITYYADEAGSGTTCSQVLPCTVAEGMAKLTASDTLYLLDGTYTGDYAMIDGYSFGELHGTAEARITIAALNEGSVLIDGQNIRTPIWIYHSTYVTVQGINVKNGNVNGNIYISHGVYTASYNWLKRCISWKNGDAGSHIYISMEGYDLVEDCGAFGAARYPIGAIDSQYCTFRRNWARYTGESSDTGPKINIQLNYRNQNFIFENNIGEWDRISGDQTEEYGIFTEANNPSNYKSDLYGNIAIVRSTDSFDAGQIYFGNTFDGCTWKDNVSYSEQSKKGFWLIGTGFTNTIDHSTSIIPEGGASSVFSASWTNTNFLEQELIELYNLYTNTGSGATIRYRYVDGSLTGDSLWPWPMKDRIKAALNASSYSSSPGGAKWVDYDIDTVIQGIFGSYPSAYTACDIDEDGDEDAGDVTALVDIVLGREVSSKGDLNEDASTNILDIMILVNLVYLGGSCP